MDRERECVCVCKREREREREQRRCVALGAMQRDVRVRLCGGAYMT
jgi:hypothetical protein